MAAVQTAVARRADGTSVVACERCLLADTAWLRLRGLLGRRSLEPGDGLWLAPGNSIHMFFMRFAIDAVFVDRDGVVLDVVPGLRPWRMAMRRGAKAVLEVAAGEAERLGLAPGDRVALSARAADG